MVTKLKKLKLSTTTILSFKNLEENYYLKNDIMSENDSQRTYNYPKHPRGSK